MPGLVEADDDGLYVLKFRGAGQGPLALVAEVIGGELARALELAVPELVLCELDPVLGRAEPDPEIQELIDASAGLNLALDFLPGALPFTSAQSVDADWAAAVVWLDALITNVDRTPRNPNLLCWHGRVWLIDHGAALYRQHAADDLAAEAGRPFPAIREHVLLPSAASILEADARLAPRLSGDVLDAVVAAVPEGWLDGRHRDGYRAWLARRLAEPRAFAHEAEEARRGA